MYMYVGSPVLKNNFYRSSAISGKAHHMQSEITPWPMLTLSYDVPRIFSLQTEHVIHRRFTVKILYLPVVSTFCFKTFTINQFVGIWCTEKKPVHRELDDKGAKEFLLQTSAVDQVNEPNNCLMSALSTGSCQQQPPAWRTKVARTCCWKMKAWPVRCEFDRPSVVCC